MKAKRLDRVFKQIKGIVKEKYRGKMFNYKIKQGILELLKDRISISSVKYEDRCERILRYSISYNLDEVTIITKRHIFTYKIGIQYYQFNKTSYIHGIDFTLKDTQENVPSIKDSFREFEEVMKNTISLNSEFDTKFEALKKSIEKYA